MCPGARSGTVRITESARTALFYAHVVKSQIIIEKEKATMLYCRFSSATLFLCLSLALLALRPPLTQAQLQLANINISRAVEILEERFRQVANDGLGVDALKVSILSKHSTFKSRQSTVDPLSMLQ